MPTKRMPASKKATAKKSAAAKKTITKKSSSKKSGASQSKAPSTKMSVANDRWSSWAVAFANPADSTDCKVISERLNGLQMIAYKGDAMTLLAFDLDVEKTKNFVGFSIECQPGTNPPYFLYNSLSFEQKFNEKDKKQASVLPAGSDKAPVQKYRWLHVAGDLHQHLNDPFFGEYTYRVTPRYWQNGALQALDSSLTVSVKIKVEPFVSQTKKITLGFARGFVSSQAYVHRFGLNVALRPPDSLNTLVFDTSQQSGSQNGVSYTFKDQYQWSGFTAYKQLFALLDEVANDSHATIDVFAYDLDEPDVCKLFLALAKEGRIRVILDNAKLHTVPNTKKGQKKTFENQFEAAFNAVKKGESAIVRGKFARFAHDKVIIVKKDNVPVKVLTGSTNFSLNGLCINANHILIFNDASIASLYEKVFEKSFSTELMKAFSSTDLAQGPQQVDGTDYAHFNFSPHKTDVAGTLLTNIANNIERANRCVLFSVMALAGGGPVLEQLRKESNNPNVLSYGVTDLGEPEVDSSGTQSDQTVQAVQYKSGSRTGQLINTKKGTSLLPPPFDKEPTYQAHKIHHKFVVIDFNSSNPKLYCGSSNLALGGEQQNGDNLIEITDRDVATVFAIEAVRLVDHYAFRTAIDTKGKSRPLMLDKTEKWSKRYYNKNDIKYIDRLYFSR